MLHSGEKILPFGLCQHYVHQDCLKVYAEEYLGNQIEKAALTCPKCSVDPADSQTVDADTTLEEFCSKIPSQSISTFVEDFRRQSRLDMAKEMIPRTVCQSPCMFPAEPDLVTLFNTNTVLALRIENPIVKISSDYSAVDRTGNQGRLITALISIVSPGQVTDHIIKQPKSPSDSLNSIISAYTRAPMTPVYPEKVFSNGQMGNADEKLRELCKRVVEWNDIHINLAGRLLSWDFVHVGTDENSEAFECFLFERSMIFVSQAVQRMRSKTEIHYIARASIPISHMLHVKDTSSDENWCLTIILTGSKAFVCKYKDQTTKHKWYVFVRSRMLRLEALKSKDSVMHSVKPLPAIPPQTMGGTISTPRLQTAAIDSAPLSGATPSMSQDSSINHHIPIDLVIVIPFGHYLGSADNALVIDTVLSIIKYFGGHDRLGLITYNLQNQESSVIINFSDNLDQYPDLVKNSLLSSGWTTNLNLGKGSEDALMSAVEMFRSKSDRSCLSHIIFVSNLTHVSRQMVGFAQTFRAKKVMLHTLGFSPSHSAEGLALCAGMTFGTYTYIDNFDKLGIQVTRIILGLLSISHTDLMLSLSIPKLKLLGNCQIVAVSGCNEVGIASDQHSANIRIPYLCHGDRMEFLVRLKIDTDYMPYNAIELLQVSTSWLNSSSDKITFLRPVSILSMPVRDQACPTANLIMITRRVECVVSSIISRVLILMSQDRVQATARLLTECRLVLVRIARVYNLKENDYIWQVDDDLSKLLDSLESTEQFRQISSKFAIGLHLALLHQRSFAVTNGSQKRYARRPQLISEHETVG